MIIISLNEFGDKLILPNGFGGITSADSVIPTEYSACVGMHGEDKNCGKGFHRRRRNSQYDSFTCSGKCGVVIPVPKTVLTYRQLEEFCNQGA